MSQIFNYQNFNNYRSMGYYSLTTYLVLQHFYVCIKGHISFMKRNKVKVKGNFESNLITFH